MENTYTAIEDIWFIINGGEFHHGLLNSGSTITSKYDILTYLNKEEWIIALEDLKVPPPVLIIPTRTEN